MRYCKFLSLENGAFVPRYAFVELRSGTLWAAEPMDAPKKILPPDLFLQPTSSLPLADLHLLAPVSALQDSLRRPQLPRPRHRTGQRGPQRAAALPQAAILAARAQRHHPHARTLQTRRLRGRTRPSSSAAAAATSAPTKMSAPTFAATPSSTTSPPATSRRPTANGPAAKASTPSAPSAPSSPTRSIPHGGAPVTLTTRLNGEIKQQGTTRDLIFPIAHLLRYITAAMTLEPGDLIPTGTPAGVGPVQPGDRIQVEIDGLGVLENTFQPE